MIDFHIEMESTVTGMHRLPADAPASTYTLRSGPETLIDWSDSFDTDTGWTVDSNTNQGVWERHQPWSSCVDEGEPGTDADGTTWCMITDRGTWLDCEHVNYGCTAIISPTLDATGDSPVLHYARWFHNDICDGVRDDVLTLSFSVDDGATWYPLETVGPEGPEAQGEWYFVEQALAGLENFTPTDTFRVKFEVCEEGATTCVEAAVDALAIHLDPCVLECLADLYGDDNVVGVDDLLLLLMYFGFPGPDGDLDGNGIVEIDDLLLLIQAWGPCPA